MRGRAGGRTSDAGATMTPLTLLLYANRLALPPSRATDRPTDMATGHGYGSVGHGMSSGA